jgi:hypothetical protein
MEGRTDFETFFAEAPAMNPARSLEMNKILRTP